MSRNATTGPASRFLRLAVMVGGVLCVAGAGLSPAMAQAPAAAPAEQHAHVTKQDWSFAGVFGQYDQAQLQRGFKIYREACGLCHSMRLLPFRALAEAGGPLFSEEAAKQIASEYTVADISNQDGQPFERPATLTDHIPGPYPNKIAAAAANGGAAPPDFSLIAKARAEHRGFPGFVTDAFAGYQEAGPDYIHALLLGYEEVPEGVEVVPGKYYNPTYINGDWIAMPQPIQEGQVEYTDGTPETLDQYAADVSAFLMWVAEPKLEVRKELGFRVIIFLAVFAVLIFMTKQKLWRNIEH